MMQGGHSGCDSALDSLFEEKLTLSSVAAASSNPKRTRGESSSDSSPSNDEATIHDFLTTAGGDPSTQLAATRGIRKLLSRERAPPYQEVVQGGAIPLLVGLASQANMPAVQLESIWALTNLLSGPAEVVRAVIDNNAASVLIHALASPAVDVQEQAVWALGNIAGDSVPMREYLHSLSISQHLLPVFKQDSSRGTWQTGMWAIVNLCRGLPIVDFEKVACLLPVVVAALNMGDGGGDAVVDACWVLSYLSIGDDERLQQLLTALQALRPDILTHLSRLLVGHQQCAVKVPIVRLFGNVATGTDEQCQMVIDCDALSAMREVLSRCNGGTVEHNQFPLVKDVMWCFSNIAAGTSAQVQALVSSGAIYDVFAAFSLGIDDIDREALWALTNTCSGCCALDIIPGLLQMGIMTHLLTVLRRTGRPDCVDLIVDTIETLLRSNEDSRVALGLPAAPWDSILNTAEVHCALEEVPGRFPMITDKVDRTIQAYFANNDAE